MCCGVLCVPCAVCAVCCVLYANTTPSTSPSSSPSSSPSHTGRANSKDGSDDVSKGSNLLEVYALQIQMYAKEKNTAALKAIYPKTEELNAAIKDPRIMR